MRTTISFVLLTCGLLSVTPLAQQPPAGQPPSPPLTFKVEVNYVEIDAVVTDEQGNFVRNLTKDDFQVVEDGQPQTVSAFASVDIPIERADPPLFAKNAIPPDVATNRTPFQGRVFVIVIDDLHINFARTSRVRETVHRALRRHQRPRGSREYAGAVRCDAGFHQQSSARAQGRRSSDGAGGGIVDEGRAAGLFAEPGHAGRRLADQSGLQRARAIYECAQLARYAPKSFRIRVGHARAPEGHRAVQRRDQLRRREYHPEPLRD